LIGYTLAVNFNEGLMENIEWFKDNCDKIEESADFPHGLSSAVRDSKEIVKWASKRRERSSVGIFMHM